MAKRITDFFSNVNCIAACASETRSQITTPISIPSFIPETLACSTIKLISPAKRTKKKKIYPNYFSSSVLFIKIPFFSKCFNHTFPKSPGENHSDAREKQMNAEINTATISMDTFTIIILTSFLL